MRRFTPGFSLLLVGTIVLAACDDAGEPTSPQATGNGLPITASSESLLDVVARAVPEFGGLFIDEDGVPTVYLTDEGKRGAVQKELGQFLAERGFAPSEIRVRKAKFAYADLNDWFRDASPEVLEMPGVVFVDLDEANNRLLVGVEGPGAMREVRRIAARMGIPADAMEVRETSPIQFAATLRDRVRPVQGGLQIHFSSYLCTLGFNAIRSGQASFITNSHCTSVQGGTESTQYYQPLSSVDGTVIATEVADPTYWTGGSCPAGRRCRYSDSARAAYSSGVSYALGSIARTSSRGRWSGSLTITGSFSITSKRNPVAGETANKIGRTTGWTYGPITNTCVNVNVSGSNITLLCQSLVQAGVGGGDSGSPVIGWSGSGSSVTLFGILWGGSSTGDLFVFSPISQVEQELGSLTVW